MKELLEIQAELKAPKNRKNSFGNYQYRSCEDILEAVKPLLKNHDCTLTLADEVVNIGAHNYIKATATFIHDKEVVTVSAYAREAENKKGMDDSQITGTSSSYARKYALNGLFLIDDTKDADTDEYKKENKGKASSKADEEPDEYLNNSDVKISKADVKLIDDLITETDANRPAFMEYYGLKKLEDMTIKQKADAVMRLSKKETQGVINA